MQLAVLLRSGSSRSPKVPDQSNTESDDQAEEDSNPKKPAQIRAVSRHDLKERVDEAFRTLRVLQNCYYQCMRHAYRDARRSGFRHARVH